MTWRLIEADCVEAMQAMDEGSVDAIVTDPPYGLEFMGKEWDNFRVDNPGTKRHRGERAGAQGTKGTTDERWTGADGRSMPAGCVNYGGPNRPRTNRCTGCGKRDQFRNDHDCTSEARWQSEIIDPHSAPPQSRAFQAWCTAWATEALRVLKPGGHLLVFGGTRTYHRLACAVEDAGFEIRDCLTWLYGSGFPKSLDVSKAIDKAAGAEREVVGAGHRPSGGATYDKRPSRPDGLYAADAYDITAPATPDAQRWQGWGTALKPAFEPIVLARKPLVGTVAANVLEYGTGALNIDGTRIEMSETDREVIDNMGGFGEVDGHVPNQVYGTYGPSPSAAHPSGRWPANVVLDEEAAAMLDEQSGASGERARILNRNGKRASEGWGLAAESKGIVHEDFGGASRFFYVPKADSAERNRGLEHYAGRAIPDNAVSRAEQDNEHARRPNRAAVANHHPTVKPAELMQWLCRLITPPGGVVLDPFTGSGSTGIAALREGFSFIGIEREADYIEIARDRIIGDAPLLNVGAEVVA